jgi:hypothetical protein
MSTLAGDVLAHHRRRAEEHTELVEAEDEQRLVDLEAQDLRLDEGQRLSVDLDQTLPFLQCPSAVFLVGVKGRMPCSGQRRSQSSSCRTTRCQNNGCRVIE